MDDLFQRTLGPTFIILNFPKNFGENWNQTAFNKKKWEVLMKIEEIHAISVLYPISGRSSHFRVKELENNLFKLFNTSYLTDSYIDLTLEWNLYPKIQFLA